MSLSKEYTKYYLTDAGWVNVYSRTDYKDEKQDNPVPEKYYMICTYREEQSSPYSEMYKDTYTEFKDHNETEKIQELIKEHGPCPQSL